MRLTIFIWLVTLLQSNATCQSFEQYFSVPAIDNIVTDVQQISDSLYIGITPYANTNAPLADSLHIFSLDAVGDKKAEIFVTSQSFKYSRLWKSIIIPDDTLGRIVYYGNIALPDFSRKAYVFCIDRNLNMLWEYVDVEQDTSAYIYEGLPDACIKNGKLLFYGVWTNLTSPAAPDAQIFLLQLDYSGQEVDFRPITSMTGRVFGNDHFLVTATDIYFFNARNRYYKCDKATLTLSDSFDISLDTARIRGYPALLQNGNIALLCYSDTIVSFIPPVTGGAPTVLILDAQGVYQKRIRKFTHIADEGKGYAYGLAVLPNGDFVIPGFEGYNGGEPKSDWFSLHRFSQQGNLVYERYYRLGKRFNSYRTRACPDGGVLVTGYTYLNGERDGQVYKFDSLGNLSTIVPISQPAKQQLLVFVKSYPNPAADILYFESESSYTYTIEITSIDGKVMHRAQVQSAQHQVDVSGFGVGGYFVVLRDAAGQPFQKRTVVIKQ